MCLRDKCKEKSSTCDLLQDNNLAASLLPSSHFCSNATTASHPLLYRTCTFHNLYLFQGRAWYITDGANGACAFTTTCCSSSLVARSMFTGSHLPLMCLPADGLTATLAACADAQVTLQTLSSWGLPSRSG